MGSDRVVVELCDVRYEIGDRVLLSGLDLTVHSGESVALMGPSGSGKSTLLSLILGLLRPVSGRVLVRGTDLAGLPQRAMAELRRRHVGMVFQFGELIPELRPEENVALAALLGRAGRSSALDRAERLLAELGVPTAADTARLSGGERQRTAVARALINSPDVVLADEPTGSLDASSRDKVAELLFDLPSTRKCGLLVATHDESIARRADRVFRLHEGGLVPEVVN